jgi:succinoglycan biosynthesis protein ExoM
MRIAICVATYKRPSLLANLIDGLSRLDVERLEGATLEVIIVDNDSNGSAEPVVRQTPMPWPIRYAIESRRGIAQARNCALRLAAGADFVAFIDDDERPDPIWLTHLVSTQKKYDADVVSGPVYPAFEADVPKWIQEGPFFLPPSDPTGTLLDSCATNNALVKRGVFQAIGNFDEQFQLTGADDLHFFRRVYKEKYKIVWCADAAVSEIIGSDRGNLGWLLRRAYRGGNCQSLVEISLDNSSKTRALRTAKALVRIAQGTAEMVLAPLRGRIHATRSLRRICLGVGMITGLFRLQYQTYQTVTGN